MKTSKLGLSPQKEKLVAILRDLKPHCASEWARFVKDDRVRFVEINRDYMATKGYKITSVPCRGTVCGRKSCPLNKRQAIKLGLAATAHPNNCEACSAAKAATTAWV